MLRNEESIATVTTLGRTEEDAYSAVPNTAPASDWPNCREVWVVGQILPLDYTGCIRADEWTDESGQPIPSRSMDITGIPGDGFRCRDGGFLARGWFGDGRVSTPTGTTVLGRLTIYFARLGGSIDSDVWAPNSGEDAAFEAAVVECRG